MILWSHNDFLIRHVHVVNGQTMISALHKVV